MATGIFANLAFEQTGLDMVAFAIEAAGALLLLVSAGPDRARLPLTLYTAAAFGSCLLAALGYQLLE